MGKKRKTTKTAKVNQDHILWNELIDCRDSPARKKSANKTSSHCLHKTISHTKTKAYCIMLLKYQDDRRYREEAADLAQTLLSHCHHHDLDDAINVILRVGARNHTLAKLVYYYQKKQHLTTTKNHQIRRHIRNYSCETSWRKRRNIELELLMEDPDHPILQEIIASRNSHASLFKLFKQRLLSHSKADNTTTYPLKMLSIAKLLMRSPLRPQIKLIVKIFQYSLISMRDNEPTSNLVFRNMVSAIEHPIALRKHTTLSTTKTSSTKIGATLPIYMRPTLDLQSIDHQPTACSRGEKQSDRLVQICRGLSSSLVGKKNTIPSFRNSRHHHQRDWCTNRGAGKITKKNNIKMRLS